jgi:CHAT domain-containing protein
MAALNADTQQVALGLAHLPWELLHDGDHFLMMRLAVAALPVRQVQTRVGAVAEPQNRPLRLLLMATSPDAPGIAPLQYEAEETNIIQATKAQNQMLDLVVEESGSVEELQSLVQSYRADHFDVFHLTGHGLIYQGQPCFVTEDAFGQPVFSMARDLAAAFKNRWPRVVFLSGCHTGEVPNEGTVPSMAAALIRAGAGVVLGWARPVYDRTGYCGR